MKQNKCLVDVASAKMYVEGTEHELQIKGHLWCLRVSLKETICIPPRSEMVCQGHLLLPSDTEYRGPLVIEASEKFQKLGNALVARSLTNAGKEVLLRLMNVSCNPQTVYKNTVVGSTSLIVNIIENKEQSNNFHAENIQSDTDVIPDRSMLRNFT